MRQLAGKIVTVTVSLFVGASAGTRIIRAEQQQASAGFVPGMAGPFLERGDYPESLGRAVEGVLRQHRFTTPWIVTRGPDQSTWFIVERIESAHRFDRLSLRVPSTGEVTCSIAPYQFGPSDWAGLGKLFVDLSPEAKEIAAALGPSAQARSHDRAYTLGLHYGGRSLPQDVLERLYAKAVEILESSNFNSRAPRWPWNMSELQQQYRETVKGNYFVVCFQQPETFTTVEGPVTVSEIIIGLNGRQYASALFTIDEEGRLVGHAKYSGPLCVDFLKLVTEAIHP